MSDILTDLYGATVMQDNVYAKALANFIFRQVIEDAHSEYNIPQEDIKKMCKDAVNRAAVFLQILENKKLYRAFAIEAIDGIKWDEPEMTADLEKRMEFYKSLSDKLGGK